MADRVRAHFRGMSGGPPQNVLSQDMVNYRYISNTWQISLT
jgi:hypothetical protein